ncbi:MAG: hypothetical protein RLZZ283_509 [Candidatus Parcubacteria bacterium]|jgi:hypothetical protein
MKNERPKAPAGYEYNYRGDLRKTLEQMVEDGEIDRAHVVSGPVVIKKSRTTVRSSKDTEFPF